jgi:hypothetical protein
MINQRTIYIYGFILACLLAFGIYISTTTNIHDDAYWQSYFSPQNSFVFKYPKDWEITDDGFYKTAYMITIQKIGDSDNSNDWIRINSPQFQEQYGRCIEAYNQKICTYSSDEDVLEIFEMVAASFRLEESK